MIIKNKNKIIILIFIIILVVTLLILSQTGVIDRITQNARQEEIKKEISYEVYKHVNGKTAMLVIAEDTENGIEKIIYPNNEMELYCNGKTKVAFDYNTDITGKESLTFKMVDTLGEEIEKTIQINDQFYLEMIDYSFTKETETQQALTVNYKEGSKTKQYKIGEGETWTNYENDIRLDDYQILETLGNENRNVNVSLRQIDNIGNEIIVDVKHTIPDTVTYKQEDTLIEGESILACVENNNLESGNYIFRITGMVQEENGEGVLQTKTETIDYPIELYNYNDDANYKELNNVVIGNTKYTGIGKANSEKRMLILKYNKNLNIEEKTTITPTGTSETINGVTHLCTKKGMFIYCAEKITNNGEITMTAKGTVNQEGENVYLYKNEDNTYEYIPAVGGTGGASVRDSGIGKNGLTGTIRKTGGGGSGGAWNTFKGPPISGSGSSGTSYSGGTGGGSVETNGAGTKYAGNGGLNGGPGGNATDSNVGGGAGNPGGWHNGQSGTGGLLILYVNVLNNNGSINSNGSNGGVGFYAGGGGSGGGSINVFYKTSITKGIITSTYGSGGYGQAASTEGHYNGGNGGAGCTTIGSISTGTFVKDE